MAISMMETPRTGNVRVTIEHSAGTAEVRVNQRTTPPLEKGYATLGTFDFGASAAVTISNQNADGYVVIDSVQWLRVPNN